MRKHFSQSRSRPSHRLLVELLESRNLLSTTPPSALGLTALPIDPTNYDPSSVLVRFQPGSVYTGDVLAKGIQVGAPLPLVSGLYHVNLQVGISVDSALSTLRAHASVLYAQPNYQIHVNLTPNDPLYPQQYDLNNIGQTGGADNADINGPEAWDTFTGSSKVTVAVIDTGIDYDHPDLYLNQWIDQGEIPSQWRAGPSLGTIVQRSQVTDVDSDDLISFRDLNAPANAGLVNDVNGDGHIDAGDILANVNQGGWADGADSDGNGFVDDLVGWNFAANTNVPNDDYGHGTHVAGTIGADTNNGIGIAGIAWNVNLMAVKFLDANGSGSLENAILALNYAVANGATISNNSWGGGGYDAALHDAIQAAAAHDHIFVAAAGNDSMNNDFSPAYPASYDLDNIISVAATDNNDQLAYFSNYGANSVDLGAPGVDTLSTLPTSGPLGDPSGYGTLSGTSMATPHVTGVVALVRGQHPDWSYSRVIQQILANVDPIPALDGMTVTGGRLDAARALTGIIPPDTNGPRVTATDPQGATVGPVSSMRVTFNEAIDPTIFTLDDITSFTDPDGNPIVVTDIQPIGTTNIRTFNLMFAPQTTLGDYQLVLGPDITDLAGNPMNQDHDATNGEPIEDQFTGGFSISDQLQFQSTDTPQYIDWFWAATSSITIDQDATIGDLNLTLNISHPYTGDLAMYLIAPDGTYITLSMFDGAGANFDNTTFDDQASISIDAGAAPFAGSYQPIEPLSTYNGYNARGTWTLEVDNWGFETGWLNSWSMSILPGSGTLPPPPSPPPSNSPPTPADDFATTNEDTPVNVPALANDSDPDGDSLTLVSVDWTSGGTAVINPDQTVTFTPDPNFNGSASFGYTVSDGFQSASAMATITVDPVNDPPVAINDVVNAIRDTPTTIDGSQLTANDTDVDGDFLSVVSVANPVNGSVTFDGNAIVFTPNPRFAGWAGFDYTITDGQATATAHVDVNVRSVYYFTTTAGATLTNSDGSTITFANTDIMSLVENADGTYSYQRFFNGRAVGLNTSSERIDAFTFLADGSILVSTAGAYSVPNGLGGSISGAGEDLLQFTPSSLGDTTSGNWSIYFDGSDVGLSGTAENVDAVAVLPDGRILISTAGAPSVPGVTLGGQAADLLAFTPHSLGANTSGTWAIYFDGSDVGLGGTAENVDGLFVQPSTTGGLPTLYLSTAGSFSVPGLSGGRSDIMEFTPTTLGSNTSGTFTSPVTLAGASVGLGGFNIDGFALGVAPGQDLAGGLSLRKSKTTNDWSRLFADIPTDWTANTQSLGAKATADNSLQAIWDWLVFEAQQTPHKKK